MRLTRVTIKDFRSIQSLDLFVEEDLTTLVGANEHGKSNILYALRLLDPSVDFQIEQDSRIENTGKQLKPNIKFYLSLDAKDREKIMKQAQSLFPSMSTKNSDGTTNQSPPTKTYKMRDIPEDIEFTRKFKEDDSEQTTLNITDNELRETIFQFIKNDVAEKIIFFDDFQDRLNSVIPKEEIIDNKDNLIIQGLLKVGGLTGFEEEIFTDDRQAGILFEKAPEKLTKAVKQAWFQGSVDEIEIKLKKDNNGAHLVVNIEDKNTYVEFGARSRGFKWFLSFYLKYRAHHDGELTNAIFLMDEPGLFLHPKGQKDLMRYIEKLSKKNQIIYTTHSPFMINRLHAKRVRVVSKVQKKGTVINSKGFTANWRHLRSSLGMVLSDSFYFADKTLIVEGPEDVIYILSLLKFFIERENLDLDVNLLSVMDAGGATNLPAMSHLVKDEERPLIVLIDSDSTKTLNRLKKSLDEKKEIKEVKSFSIDAITIQDLLPKNIYEAAVNTYLKKLADDGFIKKPSSTSPFPQYVVQAATAKLDKHVEEFVKLNFGEDDVSKVGIAREFEEILKNPKTSITSDFVLSRQLIDWVINSLNLKI